MTPAPQSSFVTVLAWLTLVMGVLGVVSALLQGLLATTALPTLQAEYGGAVTRLLSNLTVISLALSLFSVWVGLRLLQRREWARCAMVALLAIGLVLAVVGAIACLGALFTVEGVVLSQAGLPEELFPLFRAMLAVLAAGALIIVGVHAWLIVRLRSAGIRAEFVA